MRVIFRCANDACKPWAFDYVLGSKAFGVYRETEKGEKRFPFNDTQCPTCGKRCGHKGMNYVEGQFSEKRRCDARCVNAKGPDCVCACGGANHGAGWTGGVQRLATEAT